MTTSFDSRYFFTDNPKATRKRTEQLPTMLNTVASCWPAKLNPFAGGWVIHLWLKILAFCPAQPKWNQKLQCLLLRESNNPIIFIWEFPGPSNEQDWDDEHNCLMGYYNNIPNNIQSHLKDIDKILNSTRKITIVGTKIGSFSTNDYYVVSSSNLWFFHFFSLSSLYWK